MVSEMEFYCYRLMQRSNTSYLHASGRLLQQYMVDQYAKVEQGRINWVKRNQATIRSALYQGLVDAVAAGDGSRAGRRIILPSSFQGGPRHMHMLYQDAMAIVRKYGKPTFFITFTCNPRWDEIALELKPGQTAHDRPDLISRVFNLKKKQLLKDILDGMIFGHVQAHVHTIEFQKRGLPHCHMLFILDNQNNIWQDVDNVICAELPDPVSSPRLYGIVKRCMIHGPCGLNLNPRSPCMGDDYRCGKGFPKEFCM